MNKVTRQKGIRKYLSLLYWRIQIRSVFTKGSALNIEEIRTVEVDDASDLAKLFDEGST